MGSANVSGPANTFGDGVARTRSLVDFELLCSNNLWKSLPIRLHLLRNLSRVLIFFASAGSTSGGTSIFVGAEDLKSLEILRAIEIFGCAEKS